MIYYLKIKTDIRETELKKEIEHIFATDVLYETKLFLLSKNIDNEKTYIIEFVNVLNSETVKNLELIILSELTMLARLYKTQIEYVELKKD